MKGAIFDFDGTLVDSMRCWSTVWENMFLMYGKSMPSGFIREITPLGAGAAIDYIKKLGVSDDKEKIQQVLTAKILYEYTNNIMLKAGVAEYIDKLRSSGIKTAILTASPSLAVLHYLERTGLSGKFEFICSCGEIGYKKSDMGVYKIAAQRMGENPGDITMHDDNILALAAAKNAGLQTVGVYDEFSAEDMEKIKEFTDNYIMSFLELV